MNASTQFAKKDKQYIWHPFTQMQEWNTAETLVIASAKGSYLRDTQGRRYLDGVSSLWCNVHGHRVPAVDLAVRRQLKAVAHSTFLGLSNVPAIQLSEKLVKVSPRSLKRVFYSDSGSTAVEIALKMAYQYWRHKGEAQKRFFVHLTNAYHGDTVGSISVGGIDLFHRLFEKLLFKTLAVEAPNRYAQGFRGTDEQYARVCAARMERVLQKNAGRVAAIIMEPLIQGAAGMVTHPKGYLRRVRALATRYKTLLILDEVATGFGRTGKMFACEHEQVEPDLLCLAKGISAGYLPLAATLTTDDIYRTFLGKYEEFKTFFHGHTYTANPLACAAALANLEYFKRHKVIKKSQAQIRCLREALLDFRQLRHVGDIRQLGMMVGIELVQDKPARKPYSIQNKIGIRVAMAARKQGVIIRPLGNVMILMPPFSFTDRQLKSLCRATYRAIQEATQDAEQES